MSRCEVTGTSNPMRRGGAKSFVDDLGWSRGVVLSRAATLLRSIETQPCRLEDLFASRRAYIFEEEESFGIFLKFFQSTNAVVVYCYSRSSSSDVREFDSHHRQSNDCAGAKWAVSPVGPASEEKLLSLIETANDRHTVTS